MENENEMPNSENGEEETSDDLEGLDEDALKERARAEATKRAELEEKNRQLFERAKKAEGFEKQDDGSWVKVIERPKAGRPKKETEPDPPQSNEPDYSKIAFLEGRQVSHPDDQKLVMDEANRLKLPLTDILGMEHIKAKLQTNKDARDSKGAMPKGNGRSGGNTRSDVDYYLDHPDEVPEDLELHNKVIDAKVKKETNANMFSDVPFVG